VCQQLAHSCYGKENGRDGRELNLQPPDIRHIKAKQREVRSDSGMHTWQTSAAVLLAFHAVRVWTADDCPQWPAVAPRTASLSPVSLVLDRTPDITHQACMAHWHYDTQPGMHNYLIKSVLWSLSYNITLVTHNSNVK